MRLSEWRKAAPHKDAGSAKLAAIVDPVLASLGAEADPHAWVAWGEEPGTRYTILVVTDPGLISCFVRLNVAGEGPRASAKLVRWSRVQTSELAIETSGSHRLLSFQIESHVLQGADGVADGIAGFALDVFAAMDGRPRPQPRPVERGVVLRPPPAPRLRRPARAARPADRHVHTRRRIAGRPAGRGRPPRPAGDPLLGQPGDRVDRRPGLPPAAPRGPRAPPGRARDLLLQPHELDGPVRADGDAADEAPPVLLRAEGGGHGRRAAEPAHELDVRHGPVPARARTTCSRRRGGSARSSRAAASSRSRGRAGSTPRSTTCCASRRGRRTSRSARACRSSRSRSAARAGSGWAGGSGSSSASRSRSPGGRAARPSTS